MSETIVFFGSGPVAAKALELLTQYCSIEAVITKPQPPHHKGTFPVLDVAARHEMPVLTASNKHELSEIITKQKFTSRVAVLIDFGIIVAQDVIDAFPLGIVNSHFSLLPEWRGADPITFAILSGQEQTGVSLMLLVAAMDEGPLLAQTPVAVSPHITISELTDELISASDNTLQAILPLYFEGKAQPAPQEQVTMAFAKIPTYSRKLTKEDGVLDWSKPAIQLEREVRAFLEWPKSQTKLSGQSLIITAAHVENGNDSPGKIFTQNKKLGFYTTKDIFVIDRLKPAGKGEMTTEAFLAGYGTKL